jgi:hypothetical protein
MLAITLALNAAEHGTLESFQAPGVVPRSPQPWWSRRRAVLMIRVPS